MRFPGFEGEWKGVTIGQICNIVGGGTPDTNNKLYWNGDIQWFTPSEVGKEKYVFDSNRTISIEGLKNSSAKLLPPFSILLSSRATVGECSINLKECCTNQGFQSAVPNVDITSTEFLYYRLLTHKREFIKKACGSTFLEISAKQISKLNTFIPTRSEQEKISALFSLVDERISIQNKVIEKYESLIKAINQRHFKNVRENDSLTPVKLSMILRERKEYCENDGTYPHASLSKDGINKKTERYDRDFLVRDEEKKYKVTRLNDICYNPANLKFGVISRNKIGTLIFSPIYVTFEIAHNYDTDYMEYYLTNPDFVKYMLKYEQGTVYERMAVSPEDFLTESIRVPSLSEQQKHAAIISSLNSRLDDERMTLINWCRFKQGCLKQLFI